MDLNGDQNYGPLLPLDHDWLSTHRFLDRERISPDLLPLVIFAARSRLKRTIRRLNEEVMLSRLTVERARELQAETRKVSKVSMYFLSVTVEPARELQALFRAGRAEKTPTTQTNTPNSRSD